MVSTADRTVAVPEWWVPWPAGPVNDLVITDRSLRELEDHIYPPEYDIESQEIVKSIRGEPDIDDPDVAIFEQDRAVTTVAQRLFEKLRTLEYLD